MIARAELSTARCDSVEGDGLRRHLPLFTEVPRKQCSRKFGHSAPQLCCDPEREAKAWLEKLAEVDRKRARYQEMAVEELITLDELRH